MYTLNFVTSWSPSIIVFKSAILRLSINVARSFLKVMMNDITLSPKMAAMQTKLNCPYLIKAFCFRIVLNVSSMCVCVWIALQE